MSQRICYTVTATIPDAATLREYVHWLEDGHVDQVIEAGAHSSMIVILDPPEAGGGSGGDGGEAGAGSAGAGAPDGPLDRPGGGTVVTQYIFSTRENFKRYEREHAPALRADGVKRFGPQTGGGVSFQRSVGVII